MSEIVPYPRGVLYNIACAANTNGQKSLMSCHAPMPLWYSLRRSTPSTSGHWLFQTRLQSASCVSTQD
jgi:hypothetical protein